MGDYLTCSITYEAMQEHTKRMIIHDLYKVKGELASPIVPTRSLIGDRYPVQKR